MDAVVRAEGCAFAAGLLDVEGAKNAASPIVRTAPLVYFASARR